MRRVPVPSPSLSIAVPGAEVAATQKVSHMDRVATAGWERQRRSSIRSTRQLVRARIFGDRSIVPVHIIPLSRPGLKRRSLRVPESAASWTFEKTAHQIGVDRGREAVAAWILVAVLFTGLMVGAI
jgi:hypothetical protein